MSNILRFVDNGVEMKIRIDGDPAEIDAMAKRFDRAAAEEVSEGVGAAHAWKVIDDAVNEIDRLNDRCDALVAGGMLVAFGSLVTGFLLGGWLL